MAIKLPTGFEITSSQPIDTRITLTKAQMLAAVDVKMPVVYFAICKDDGKLYLYNKTNTVDPETGKFRVHEGGGGSTYTAGNGININEENEISASLNDGLEFAFGGIKVKPADRSIQVGDLGVGVRKADTSLSITDDGLKVNTDVIQSKLTAGQNIKNINGQSVLGSGNISILTYQPFPSSWNTSGTLEEVINSILSDTTLTKKGMAYLGDIRGACTPFGYGNAECKVEFMLDGLAVLSVNSSNMSPYSWNYNTDSGDYKWKKYSDVVANPSGTSANDLTKLSIDGQVYNIAVSESSLANKLPGAISMAMQKEGGAEEVLDAMFNTEHFQTTIDNKIDLAIETIQAIGPTE